MVRADLLEFRINFSALVVAVRAVPVLGYAGGHTAAPTTWVISSVTTPPLRQWLVVSTLTASGYRSFSASALPSATSRTIMRLNSNRDIRCSSIDSLNTKAQFSTRPNWTFCAIVQQILLPLQVLEPRSELIISKLIKSALLTIIASGLRMEQSPSAAWTAIM